MSLLRSFVLHLGCILKFLCQNLNGIQKDMRYTMCFFPLISIPIALLVLLWFYLCQWLHIHSFLFACVIAAIPVLVTGGIHLDGYCDTVDALSSRQPREKKVRNIKRPTHRRICSAILLFVLLIVCRFCNRTCRNLHSVLLLMCSFCFPAVSAVLP